MIRDLSMTLRELLNLADQPEVRTQFPELAEAQIIFERPTEPFEPAQTTVDLFLYDIRENTELRDNETRFERRHAFTITEQSISNLMSAGVSETILDSLQAAVSQSITGKQQFLCFLEGVIGHNQVEQQKALFIQHAEKTNGQPVIIPPPLRVICYYLVTAWPVGGDDLTLQEHRLLSQVLQLLSRYPTIPGEFLQGSICRQSPPMPMMIAVPNGLDNPADFWSAIGNNLRPSLVVKITLSMPVFADRLVDLVTTKITDVEGEGIVQIGGRVLDPIGNGIANARVDIVDTGQQVTTDSQGRYVLPRVSVGTHTLRAVATGFEPRTQTLIVPGRPEDYEITLIPLQ
jgi:hypothetical protein